MNDKKKPQYIEGIGWRYELQHRETRRNNTHDYNGVGTYLITCTIADRKPLFGYVDGDLRARRGESGFAHLVPSPLAQKIIDEELCKINQLYPMVCIWRFVLMPDHLHMIVRVSSPITGGKKLGQIIGAFKSGCTRAWWSLTQQTAGGSSGPSCPVNASAWGSSGPESSASDVESRPPLFAPGFNDRILSKDGQLQHWKVYIEENPHRLLIRQRFPDIMQRALCLTIAGKRYSAYGNFMLLKVPEKHQVMCHRKATVGMLTPEERQRYGYSRATDMSAKTTVPFETTQAFADAANALIAQAFMGLPLVTPGISRGEQLIKSECISRGLPLIHLQKEPIGVLWKPERQRFYACARGKLLILAPWAEDLGGDSDYARFHNLNDLAAEICSLGVVEYQFSLQRHK